MSVTCSKLRSNGEICKRPCAEGQKKDRCAKHKGLDPKESLESSKELVLTPTKKDLKISKPPKPGSKKWQEQQGLIAVSSGGAGNEDKQVCLKNPFATPAVDLSFFDKKIFDVVSNYDGHYLVKGTPIYTGKEMKVKCGSDFSTDLEYLYLAENFLIEILKTKTHNGKGNWGNVKVPLVKNQADLIKSKPPVTFMEINTCVIMKSKILNTKPLEDDTYETLFSSGIVSKYFIPDFDEKVEEDWRKTGKLTYDERDILLFNAGNGINVCVPGEKDDRTERVINLTNASNETLNKLHSLKLKWRISGETLYDYDDTKYAHYLVKVSDTSTALDAGSRARIAIGVAL